MQLPFLTAFFGTLRYVFNNFGTGFIWRRNVIVYLKYLENDLKEFSNIKPELDMWHTKWKSVKDGLPEKLCDVLPHLEKFVFPNISFVLQL